MIRKTVYAVNRLENLSKLSLMRRITNNMEGIIVINPIGSDNPNVTFDTYADIKLDVIVNTVKTRFDSMLDSVSSGFSSSETLSLEFDIDSDNSSR